MFLVFGRDSPFALTVVKKDRKPAGIAAPQKSA
jgi:hypothetical protein